MQVLRCGHGLCCSCHTALGFDAAALAAEVPANIAPATPDLLDDIDIDELFALAEAQDVLDEDLQDFDLLDELFGPDLDMPQEDEPRRRQRSRSRSRRPGRRGQRTPSPPRRRRPVDDFPQTPFDAVTGLPRTPRVLGIPGTPPAGMPGTPVLNLPPTPRATSLPRTPGAGMPGTPVLNNLPPTPRVPGTPRAAGLPGTPRAGSLPATPRAAGLPGTPRAAGVPRTPAALPFGRTPSTPPSSFGLLPGTPIHRTPSTPPLPFGRFPATRLPLTPGGLFTATRFGAAPPAPAVPATPRFDPWHFPATPAPADRRRVPSTPRDLGAPFTTFTAAAGRVPSTPAVWSLMVPSTPAAWSLMVPSTPAVALRA